VHHLSRGVAPLRLAGRRLLTRSAALPARARAGLARAASIQMRVPLRIPRRLGELALGVAILPLGAAVSLGVAATSSVPPAPVASLQISALSHGAAVLSQGPPNAGPGFQPPILEIVPAAPSLFRLGPAADSPEIPADTYTGAEIVSIITAAAQADGVSPSWMISTAECESGLRANAYNPHGPYYGLFQFLMSTFRAHGGTDIWDPVQQSQIAASMFASGDSVAWPVCSR
jgi:hypothetical protein